MQLSDSFLFLLFLLSIKHLELMHFAHVCGIKQVQVLAVPEGFRIHQIS